MEQTNEEEAVVEESLDLPAEPAEGDEDTTDWKSEAQKLREKAIKQRESTKTLKKELAETRKAVEIALGSKKETHASNTSELNDAVLDFFDLKGYDDDQIKVFTTIMKKTGMSHREVIKDDYALAKAEEIKKEKELKSATPSSTRRSGASADTLEIAIAKYKAAGLQPSSLPTDFALKSAVINAVAAETDGNKPPWM